MHVQQENNNATVADEVNDAATGTVSLGGDSSDLTLHMDIDTDILIAMRELDSVDILKLFLHLTSSRKAKKRLIRL